MTYAQELLIKEHIELFETRVQLRKPMHHIPMVYTVQEGVVDDALEVLTTAGEGAILNIVQWAVGSAAEYGLIATGAGAPAAPFAETLIDVGFTAGDLASATSSIASIQTNFSEFSKMIGDAVESYGESWSAFYKKVRKIIREGLRVLGKGATGKVDELAEKLKKGVKNILKKLNRTIGNLIQAIIPDATIGATVATAIETLLAGLTQSPYTTVTSTIGKIPVVKDLIHEPAKFVQFFKDGFQSLIEGIIALGEKIDAGSFMEKAALAAVSPVLGALAAAGAVGKGLKWIAENVIKPVIEPATKVITQILEVVMPVVMSLLAVYQILIKGEYKEQKVTSESRKLHASDIEFAYVDNLIEQRIKLYEQAKIDLSLNTKSLSAFIA